MPYISRIFTGAALAGALLALAAPSASAARTTNNACWYELNDTWGDIPITIDSTPVQNGDKATLTNTLVNAELPQWAANYMVSLAPGDGARTLKVTAWVALAGVGSAEGTQMRVLNGTATTQVTGMTATPFVFTAPPLEDTTWTPAASALTFQQAGPGGIAGTVPAGRNGAPYTPKGSIVILATIPFSVGGGELRILIDCQPGTTPGGTSKNSTTFTPSAATPFASYTVPVVPGQSQPPAAILPASIASTKLAFGKTSVKTSIACPAGPTACRGSARLRTSAKVKLGKSRRTVTIASGTYTVPAGTTKSVTLKLSKDGKALRKARKKVGVKLSLQPSTGERTITRTLTLRVP
ncbi:MAG: hypothetical protein JHC95_08060 [Solirubrobacteraceae bacterium]|nr:hypothetical protein [Solirubrobacteraceae bacterium]